MLTPLWKINKKKVKNMKLKLCEELEPLNVRMTKKKKKNRDLNFIFF